jgi:hypothetical protein
MTAHPEHALQVMVAKWVRMNVPMPHHFFASDRSRKQSALQHVREKARGMIAGTPDTHLLLPGHPLIAIELKAPGGRPTDQQRRVGEAICAAGGMWTWVTSVTEYAAALVSAGVWLEPSAFIAAAGHDATLAGAAIKRAERTGTVSPRRYAAKPSVAQVRRAEALRAKVRF